MNIQEFYRDVFFLDMVLFHGLAPAFMVIPRAPSSCHRGGPLRVSKQFWVVRRGPDTVGRPPELRK